MHARTHDVDARLIIILEAHIFPPNVPAMKSSTWTTQKQIVGVVFRTQALMPVYSSFLHRSALKKSNYYGCKKTKNKTKQKTTTPKHRIQPVWGIIKGDR